MKIFVSSSCLKGLKTSEAVKILANYGIQNIELSGGHKREKNILPKLIELKKKYQLEYSIHNYFPPPFNDFVLNIASCDEKIYKKTINFYLKTLKICKKLKIKKYGIHCGFLVDPKPRELGNLIKESSLFDKKKSLLKMKSGLSLLNKEASGEIKIYLENNVVSKKNLNFFNSNPFFLTDKKGYIELKKKIKFNLLLDVAHLKVSCKTLGLNFIEQANYLIPKSDYIHISGNNGKADSNDGIIEHRDIIKIFKNKNLEKKILTLEIYKHPKIIKNNLNYFKKKLIN